MTESEIPKRVLKVNFNGKELLENRIFDTTSAEIAKQFAIFDAKRKYAPLTIITGEHELLPLVEKELTTMKVSEKKIIKLSPKDAFGERKTELVRIVPLKVFLDQKIKPVPGLIITVGKGIGRVQSIAGGRVRVDFNHPLAGRDIEYEATVEEEIKDKKARAEVLFEKYYSFVPNAKKTITNDKLTVELGKDTFKNLEQINKSITRLASDLGVEIEFKENAELTKKESIPIEEKKADEVLRKTIIDVEGQTPEDLKNEIPKKSLTKVFDEIVGPKKSSKTETVVTKDTATTIQRPKKK